MTDLRLVPTISEVPVWNPRNVSDIARTFADKVDNGELGEVERCIVIVETDEGLARLYWGDDITHIEAIGLLQLSLMDASQRAAARYEDRL